MRKIVIITFSIIIIVLILFFIFSDYKLVFSVKTELQTVQMTTISSMIWDDISDELIIEKMEENPSLINEECLSCVLDYQTPLLTAVGAKRTELIKYMIRNGVNVEKTISNLEGHDYLRDFSDYFKKIIEELEAAQ